MKKIVSLLILCIFMGSIITKFQKCGKPNCKCMTGFSNEFLHGPYYWHVKYIKPRNSLKKGKYKWVYIGKTEEELEFYLKTQSESDLK